MFSLVHRSQAVLGLALLFLAETALGGSFSVSPTRLVLSAERMSEMITVRNSGDAEAFVQVQPHAWLVQDGAEVLEPSAELIAVPPLFALAPGDSQVVRIGLRRAPSPDRDLTYRLLLREVPPPREEGFSGLQLLLQLSVPVLVNSVDHAPKDLNWRLGQGDDGMLEVHAHNTGNSFVKLDNLRLESVNGRVIENPDFSGYLLPGQSRTWPLAGQAAGGSRWTLTAGTDAGDLETELVIETD
jgi:fimbrial chaperone protein